MDGKIWIIDENNLSISITFKHIYITIIKNVVLKEYIITLYVVILDFFFSISLVFSEILFILDNRFLLFLNTS